MAGLMRAAFAACIVGAAGQAQEPSQWDAKIGALMAECPQLADATAPTLRQVGANLIEVQVSGTPVAVWLSDAYDDVLSFTDTVQNGASPRLVISDGINKVVAHAHYTGCSRGVSQNDFLTWQGQIDEYIAGDLDGGGVAWTDAQVSTATPRFTAVNYGARTASMSVSVPAGKTLPFIYMKSQSGTILGFLPGSGGGTRTKTLQVADLSAWESTLQACAPLGSSNVCVEHNLTPEIIAAVESTPGATTTADPAGAASPTIVGTLTSATSLRLAAPSNDVACSTPVTPAGGPEYVIYTHGIDGIAKERATDSFSHNQSLTVALDTAACNFHSADAVTPCTLTAGLLCGKTTIRTSTFDLSALYQTYLSSASDSHSAPSAPPGTVPVRCEDSHPSATAREATWKNADGQDCVCYHGEEQCGAPLDTSLIFTPMEAALIAASAFVVVLVLLACCFRTYSKSRELTELPIDGRRRSVLGAMGSSPDYVTTTKKQRGPGQEVELPAPVPPSQAGGSSPSSSQAADYPPPPPPPPPGPPPV